jgi:copper chaperone CopZ
MTQPDIQIMHAVPGRLRLKVAKVRRDADFAREVRSRLGPLSGIQSVEVNPATGSVLVCYDTRTLASPERAQAVLDTVSQLFPELDLKKYEAYLAHLGLRQG